ncbi:MAG: right-handed parallel beta-helix repeat-containing protein [Acidobacteria bacterium]|nr:right-handed parallel beta-helix repeat-containing protein [Acidobacteriota bacterium]
MNTRSKLVRGNAYVSLMFLFLVPSWALAGTTTINCDAGDTIEATLPKLRAGDTLVVSGTCREHVEITVDGLTLDGQNTATISGPSSSLNVINLIGIRGGIVRGFRITGGRDGVALHGVQMVELYSNTIENTGRDGVQVQRSSRFSSIIANLIQNNPRHGIFVNEASAVRVGFGIGIEADSDPLSNLIQGNGGEGILVSRASSARIHHNSIRNNRGNGITLEQFSHAGIAHNLIDGNTGNGILVRQSSAVNLGTDTGNNLDNLPNSTGTPNGQWGIHLMGAASADGRLGSLNGARGARQWTNDTFDSLLPQP